MLQRRPSIVAGDHMLEPTCRNDATVVTACWNRQAAMLRPRSHMLESCTSMVLQPCTVGVKTSDAQSCIDAYRMLRPIISDATTVYGGS